MQNGHVDVYSVLLEKDVIVNKKWEDGEVSLVQATDYGSVGTCTMLPDHNANVNEKWKY